MREYTTPMSGDVGTDGNLTDDIVRHARETPDRVLFARAGLILVAKRPLGAVALGQSIGEPAGMIGAA